MDGVVQLHLSTIPLFSRQTDDTAGGPCLTVVGVYLQTLLQGINGLHGVLHLHVDVGPHVIGPRKLAPASLNGVELGQCHIEVFVLDATKHTVVPESAILRVVFQRTGIVVDGLNELILLNTGKTTQLVEADDVRIATQGF